MFQLFKRDPNKKLKLAYEKKLEEAMSAQRRGDIRAYSELTEQAETLLKDLESNGAGRDG